MPFLNKDNKDGFLHCLFRRNSTPNDAHSYLFKYLGHEAMSIEEITALFEKFKNGTFKTEYPDRILLVENLKFTKHSVMEFCDLFQGNFHSKNFNNTSGMKSFLKAVCDEMEKRKESKDATKWNYYTRDFLLGFIQCLKSRGEKQERIHAELKELTLREVFTLEDVAEVFNVDEDVLVKLGYDFSELPRHLIESALNFSTIDSRVNVRRTCSFFNEIEGTIGYGINYVHLRFNGERFQLISDGKVSEKQCEPVGIGSSPSNYQVCFVHENDNVWMDTGNDDHQLKKLWNVMAHTPRCIVRDFKIGFCWMFRHPKKLLKLIGEQDTVYAQNLYFYGGRTEYFKALMKNFEPSVLEKIAIYCDVGWSLDADFLTRAQFSLAKEFITNLRCSVNSLEYFGGLKFGRFKTDQLTPDRIFELRNILLAQATDFREIKCEMLMPNIQFDAINVELGTFNKRDTENPRFAEFNYPPPNENKVLKLAVFGAFCWFQGPGWRCGEMEEVENELKHNSNREAILMQEKSFLKRDYMGAKGFELEENSVEKSKDKESDDGKNSQKVD